MQVDVEAVFTVRKYSYRASRLPGCFYYKKIYEQIPFLNPEMIISIIISDNKTNL